MLQKKTKKTIALFILRFFQNYQNYGLKAESYGYMQCWAPQVFF